MYTYMMILCDDEPRPQSESNMGDSRPWRAHRGRGETWRWISAAAAGLSARHTAETRGHAQIGATSLHI